MAATAVALHQQEELARARRPVGQSILRWPPAIPPRLLVRVAVENGGGACPAGAPRPSGAAGPSSELPTQTVDRLARLAVATVAELETTIRLAGLDPAEVAPPADPGSNAFQGGPYVAPGRYDDTAGGMAASLAALDIHLDRWDELRRVIRSLPLAEPLREYHMASPFGLRLDPLLHRPAQHEGVDLAAPYGSPVFATAGGTILFAGVKPGYGRVVEIDHGHGVTTVYAHLRNILVRAGQHVATGARIGRLGSTGRSTGPHLHYEVRVNGIPRDPAQFLYTGRLVLAEGR